MAKLTVINRDGKESGKVDLPEDIFKDRVNEEVLHQVTVMYQASLRQGQACVKERHEVSGGGKKPYKQKGTGRARAGSTRSPLWVGGGVVFGPKPRDFGYSLPKKIRKIALRESLKAKANDKNLHCLDDLTGTFEKTKEFAGILNGLKLRGKTLAILDGSDASVQKVSRNVAFLTQKRSQDVNAYDILRNKNIVVTKTALSNLIQRIKGSSQEEKASKEVAAK